MGVRVRLHGILTAPSQGGSDVELESSPGTVRNLLLLLGIPEDHVGMVVIEGRVVPLDAPINPAARVDIFPPMAGG